MTSNTIHHVPLKDVEVLEMIFARLTPQGWEIPDWLVLMRRTVKD